VGGEGGANVGGGRDKGGECGEGIKGTNVGRVKGGECMQSQMMGGGGWGKRRGILSSVCSKIFEE
jgi:hypothetical protein